MGVQEFLKKNRVSEGDEVELELSAGGKVSGIVIPSFEPEIISLKLNSGYNLGIAPEKARALKKIGAGKGVGKAKAVEIKKNPNLPTISILHTGGTIASRIDYRTGAVYAAFTPEDLMALFPSLAGIANFECKMVMNKMSEDMRFADYSKIAKAVAEEVKKGAQGVIIGHGTDTLGFTAAALAFALEGLGIPVLLVGAQRSSDRGSSDAEVNLVCAASFIAKSDFAGVAICMHDTTSDEKCAILPPAKTRKMHTSRRDAFRAVNSKPVALVDYKTKKVEFLAKDCQKKEAKRQLLVKDRFEEKTGLVKTHPNMLPEEFLFYKKNGYRGLVIEGTGLGHAPISVKEGDDAIIKAVKEVADSGCVVAVTSQCIYGRVNPSVYTNLRKLSAAGAVFCEDMLAETAFVKLAWLLGNCKNSAEVKELLPKNLRGEITERTGTESFDLEK